MRKPLVYGKRWAILFDPRDVWIGVYWNKAVHAPWNELTVWICIIPMLPIQITHVWRISDKTHKE